MENYGVDEDITSILDFYDIYIVPVFNKDGYDFSWTDVSMDIYFSFVSYSRIKYFIL